MNKILKITRFWLNKGTIAIIGLILATNLNIHQARADLLWGDIIQPAWASSLFSFSDIQIPSVGGDALMSANIPQPKIIKVTVTAYSSTPDQTKPEDPFTMASGKHVYDGAIAANFLDFGTKVKIPEVFGDKIFIVEDRMNRRFSERIDIWFPTREETIQFGKQYLEVIIL